MLYTRKGDDGSSGLFGTKERYAKTSAVYDALGTVDELNSLLGMCRTETANEHGKLNISAEIKNVQERLFIIQAELAGAEKTISGANIEELEETIESIERLIKNPHAFVIPGTTKTSALLDFARAVARRTERCVLTACETGQISPETRTYLNRVSSFLYALARYTAIKDNLPEESPSY